MSINSLRHDVIDRADEVSTSIIEVTGHYPHPPLPPCRSKRTNKPPKWIQDGEYAVNMVFRAMLNAVLDKTYSVLKSVVFNF